MAAFVGISAPAWSATVTGTVVTAGKEAKPIAGATVVVQTSTMWGRDYTPPVQTDASGRFSVTIPDNPEYTEYRKMYGVPVYVFAPGYALRQTSYKETPLTTTLSSGRTLRGTVRDTAGKPVADAPVVLGGVSISAGSVSTYLTVPVILEHFLTAKTDADGKWKLEGIPTDYDLAVLQGDAAVQKALASVYLKDLRFVIATYTITMDAATPEKEVAFVARVGGAITGRVLDGDKPVAGITTVVVNTKRRYEQDKQNDHGRAEATTDANGVFRLPHLGEGIYTVAVSAAKRDQVAVAATQIVVKTGTETALPTPLMLEKGALLEGKVVSKTTGKPVKGVYLLANGTHAPQGIYGDVLPTATTGEDGTFRLRIAPGDAQVQINSQIPGFVYFNPSLNVNVRSGETKTLAPIELTEALSVILNVSDEAGKPVPGLPVQVTHAGWLDGRNWDQMPKTDAKGEWDSSKDFISRMSADDKQPWVVRLPNGWEVVSPAEVKLPATAPVKVVVRKVDLSNRSAGRVVSPDGKPVAEAQVYVSSYLKDGNGYQTDYQSENITTGTDGSFILPMLRPNATVTVRVSKWEYRLTKKGVTEPTLKIPADGKQPKLNDWVLTPLTGTVSGKMVGATGKPVPGAWVWSYDGDTRAIARTDAKGNFTLKHIPPTGTIDMLFAAGRSSGVYSATARTNNVLRLEPSAKVVATPQARIAERKRQALRLIAEQAKEAGPGQGIRTGENDWDALADTVAAFDIPTALSLIRQKDGTIKEVHLGGVLVVATPTNPDAAKVLFDKERQKWQDPWMVFFRSFDMAMTYAVRDPAFAKDCYDTAKSTIGKGIAEDHTWTLLHLTKMAFRLGTPDADQWFTRTVEAATKQYGEANVAKGEVIKFAAQGDGVRASKYVADLPKEVRENVAVEVIGAMCELQPLEAKKLLDGWIANGTIKSQGEYDQRNMYPRLAKSLAPFDAEGASWVAKQAPRNSRPQSMLWAASAIKDPTTRQKQYRELLENTSEWDRVQLFPYAIEAARQTGDAVIVAEIRSSLAKALIDNTGVFTGNAVENVAYITLLVGEEMPDACRLMLEVAIQQTRDLNPDSENEIWGLRPAIAAMAWIDLPRALQLAESLHTPNAVADGKREIIRALLTPREKWQTLVRR